jgi:hypothetical protein
MYLLRAPTRIQIIPVLAVCTSIHGNPQPLAIVKVFGRNELDNFKGETVKPMKTSRCL